MKKDLEVVWVPRDNIVQDLVDQYLGRKIDYLALNVAFRKRGWSTAGLNEVVTYMEQQRKWADEKEVLS
jgi:hypothetical protein